MANPNPPAPEHPPYAPLAALLSYLIPGLGQISQGRIGKGLLFFVCLYGMFFTGLALGDWKNVYLAEVAHDANDIPAWENNSLHLPRGLANLYNRPHYAGQFWIGVAAWPALLQYNHAAPGFLGDFGKPPTPDEENEINVKFGKRPDVGWVYTVIAGVLNLLVIYDAFAGPAFVAEPSRPGPTPPPQEAAPA